MSESKLSKHKLNYEKTPILKIKKGKAQKEKTMSKSPKEAPIKVEKTIKVKTLVIAVSVVIALIGSFVAGMTTANSYNDKIKADAQALAEVMSKANQ